MWTLAASFSSQFDFIRHGLRRDLRELLNALESDSQDKQADCSSISIEQIQAWILLALYELTSDTCDYQRGIMSAGRAFRLVQMMRLYEVDKAGFCLGNRNGQVRGDWIDMESMRRTFWLAYTIDRFTSMVDGLHLTFNEQEVCKGWFETGFRPELTPALRFVHECQPLTPTSPVEDQSPWAFSPT